MQIRSRASIPTPMFLQQKSTIIIIIKKEGLLAHILPLEILSLPYPICRNWEGGRGGGVDRQKLCRCLHEIRPIFGRKGDVCTIGLNPQTCL